MKATQQLHDLGQRLWLENITKNSLSNPTHSRYINELAGTSPTSVVPIGCQEEPR
jgi:transaldolase